MTQKCLGNNSIGRVAVIKNIRQHLVFDWYYVNNIWKDMIPNLTFKTMSCPRSKDPMLRVGFLWNGCYITWTTTWTDSSVNAGVKNRLPIVELSVKIGEGQQAPWINSGRTSFLNLRENGDGKRVWSTVMHDFRAFCTIWYLNRLSNNWLLYAKYMECIIYIYIMTQKKKEKIVLSRVLPFVNLKKK